MKPQASTPSLCAAYYLLEVKAGYNAPTHHIIHSNSERAYIIAILQDVLRTHLYSPTNPIPKRLATTIDLLGFSITRTSISLLVFAFSVADVQNLGAILINGLIEFQEREYITRPQGIVPHANIRKLCGPHDALHVSTQLHARHTDWEYDRYSSIGFYLHGRRGDWMRLWRLTRLYDNQSEVYRAFVLAVIKISSTERATSSHA